MMHLFIQMMANPSRFVEFIKQKVLPAFIIYIDLTSYQGMV